MIFYETEIFVKVAENIFKDNELQDLKKELVETPAKGKLIPKGKGLRKIRVAIGNKGKSGGARVIYYWISQDDKIHLIFAYKKNKQENLTSKQLKTLTDLIK